MTGRSKNKSAARRDVGVTLGALRTYIAVVESESFSKAAEILGVSQPSVSSQLNGLEKAYGVLLLRRRPRIEPTKPGRELLVRAKLILSRLAEFEDSLKDLKRLAQGQLSVGLSGPHFTMPLIASFLDQFPALSLATLVGNTTELIDHLARCRIDVALVSMTEPIPGFRCVPIARLRLAACVRADDPLAARKRVAPSALAGRPLIVREEGSLTRRVTERALAQVGVEPVTRMTVDGREAMKEAIVAGLGVGTLFIHETDGDVRLGVAEITGPVEDVHVYAVAFEESFDIPAVGAFIEHLSREGPNLQRSRPRTA